MVSGTDDFVVGGEEAGAFAGWKLHHGIEQWLLGDLRTYTQGGVPLNGFQEILSSSSAMV